jgi:hypothetical protein
MRIAGLTVCVDYADLLGRSLPRWAAGLDDLVVVTAPRDAATLELCRECGVRTLATDVFWDRGAAFNKAAAMELGLATLPQDEWVLLFDADIIPPQTWRQQVELSNCRPGRLYGARRHEEGGQPINDGELAGFFQLWHGTDPAAQDRPLLGSWSNCSAYDSEFMRRWPPERRFILPLDVTHVGRPGQNWCGRGRSAEMMRMFFERARHGGYRHEQLT